METHPIPEGRWEVIHADWITDLPMTAKGHDAILVVHDRVTKYAYFIPASKTDTAEDTASKLFAQVFCLHGLPLQLISDRDRLFTAQFFAQLMRIMNVKQVMGTSYQHNFNGAAERLNRTVEVMLRHVVGEHPDRDFDDYLPFLQWSYNTTKHDSIGVSPFYAQWGYEPRQILPITDEQQLPNQHQALRGGGCRTPTTSPHTSEKRTNGGTLHYGTVYKQGKKGAQRYQSRRQGIPVDEKYRNCTHTTDGQETEKNVSWDHTV